MNLPVFGIVIATLSLIVNFLQLRINSRLKKKIRSLEQCVGDNSNASQQTHSGRGNNINAGGNVSVG